MPKPRSRMDREAKTVQAMIALYCEKHHGAHGGVCSHCQELERYALARLRRCPYQEAKTTCARCPVHCYRPDMRQTMRGVMRYAGPRMLYRHPMLAILHLYDGLRKPLSPSSTRTQSASAKAEDGSERSQG